MVVAGESLPSFHYHMTENINLINIRENMVLVQYPIHSVDLYYCGEV